MKKHEIQVLLAELKLTMEFEFVPYSKSPKAKKNAKVDDMSLNYVVHAYKDDKEILTTPYGMGIAHCPSYKQSWNTRMSVDEMEAIKQECETGCACMARYMKGKPIDPDPLDVWHCLLCDASAMQDGGFEDWCSNLGYDTDSREAERIYNQCVDIGLKLQRSVGYDNLQKLHEAYQDY